MAIKELITLEGAEEVKSALKDLSRSGEDFMANLNKLGKTGSPEMQQYVQSVKDATGANAEHGHSVSSIYEAYHILTPVLRAAGLEVSNFRGWAILARAGLEGLAVAITATVVVALARLADSSAMAQRRLETLLNLKPGTGTSAVAGLEEDAARLGMTVDQVQPGVEKFVSAMRQAKAATGAVIVFPPGGSPPAIFAQEIQKAVTAYLALVEALRAGGATQAKAAQEAANFGTALGKAGKVTAEVIQSLDPYGGAIQAIAQALNLTGLNAEQLADRLKKNPREIDELIKGLNRLEPAMRAAFEARHITEWDDALQQAETNWLNFIKDVATSKPGIGFLNVLGQMPLDAKAAFDAIKRDYSQLKAFFSKPVSEWKWEDFQKIGQDSKDSAAIAQSSWDQATQSIKSMSDEAVKAGEQMLAEWQKVQQVQSTTNKWITPTGTVAAPTIPSLMLTPSAPPEQKTQTLVKPFQEADNQIRIIWLDLTQWISESLGEINLSNLTDALVSPFRNALPQIQDALSQVSQMILRIIQQAQAAQQAVQSIGQGGAFQSPGWIEVAGGGLIRGPGTGTSDSIPAWLSAGEFVVPSRAVDFYGANFLEAIRRLQFPRNVRFAEGGMARTESNRSLTLVLDTQRFNLSGKSSVIDALERHATLQGISSIGRPPGWVR